MRAVFACALALVSVGMLLQAQLEAKRITFYTTQTSYSLQIVDRNNAEYVGLLEALEPLGPVSAKLDGNKWKLKFVDSEAQFENGKTRAKVRGKSIELPAGFLIENGRGLIPIRSLKDVLSVILGSSPDVHESARRVFIGVSPTRVDARKAEPGRVAFTFSAPVNPFIATEAGKLRMVFSRDPLQAEWQNQSFDDRVISSATYAESNGAAELTINSSAPLIASFSEDRKTITIAAVTPPPAPAQATVRTQQGPPANPSPVAPAARPGPAIILDAAHGGTDPGAALSDKIVEKDITLAIARQLKRELEARGLVCLMLRDGDESMTVADRASAANNSKAALYVAIHASTVSSGVRTFTSPVPQEPSKPLQFLRANAAQAPYVQTSRAVASAISTELLKRDMQGVSSPAPVNPLSNVHLAAVAIEVAPPTHGSVADLASSSYQRSISAALASALAKAHTRLEAR